MKIFNERFFFCFVRVPPSTAYPIQLPALSLSSALPPAIHLHIWTCVCRMWNTLNEHATCHKRDSVPSPPWYAPGPVATSNEPLDLNTFQGLVVVVAVRRRTCSSENHSSARARLVIHMDEYDVHTLGPCARRA